jgi:uncharacterized membrane protein
VVAVFEVKRKFWMKRIAVFTLLVALSVAWSIPAEAQRVSAAENARLSQKAADKQQRMLRKAAKKQRKAMQKDEKARRKAVKKSSQKQFG